MNYRDQTITDSAHQYLHVHHTVFLNYNLLFPDQHFLKIKKVSIKCHLDN